MTGLPTDPGAEAGRGRVALWLDPGELRGLAGRCCCPDDAGEETKGRCGRPCFRAGAALHKGGH
ncbi:hypothetical protein [Streptomyces sp. NPDC093018]|uniref:hypothetical protein n=1 Tax=Streptomyces sp. NPDC093018 TaxID=3155067 RepID=UPI00343833D4